ncbi:hypothetical protein [Clostridium senegalense]|uniref:hypothetical protein n=1 Tax=Clostridium senegalense TaxID=1465809 RepID=UPI00030F2629|nr:hypothetical protein [Clostridium senegalense]
MSKEIKVTVNGEITHKVLDNYITVATPILIKKYGRENIIAALNYDDKKKEL